MTASFAFLNFHTIDTANCRSRKHFRYLTPILKILPEQLTHSKLLGSQTFHFLEDPLELVEQIVRLSGLREGEGILEKPLFIWEPRPSS